MQRPIATIEAIVDFLVKRGNSVVGGGIRIDQAGHHYAMAKPIDFDALHGHFQFPRNIKAAKEHGDILDTSTWVSIVSYD